MPVVERLLREGTAGPLAALAPYDRAALWTTAATGKRPAEARRGFVAPLGDARGNPPAPAGSARLATCPGASAPSRDAAEARRSLTFWEILASRGHEAAVLGWPASSPAREGLVLWASDAFFDGDTGAAAARPAEAAARARLFQVSPDGLDRPLARALVPHGPCRRRGPARSAARSGARPDGCRSGSGGFAREARSMSRRSSSPGSPRRGPSSAPRRIPATGAFPFRKRGRGPGRGAARLLPVPRRPARGDSRARRPGAHDLPVRSRGMGAAAHARGRLALPARPEARGEPRRRAGRLRAFRGSRREVGRAPHVRERPRSGADAARPRRRAPRPGHGRARPRRGVRRAVYGVGERSDRVDVRGVGAAVNGAGRRTRAALLLALGALGVFLRVVKAGDWPAGPWIDELYFLRAARLSAVEGFRSLFGTTPMQPPDFLLSNGWRYYPSNLFLLPLAAADRLAGGGMASVRLIAVGSGVLLFLASLALATEATRERPRALLPAAVLLATSLWLLTQARWACDVVLTSAVVTAAAAAGLRAWRRSSPAWAIASGALFGLGAAGYPSARLALALPVVVFVAAWALGHRVARRLALVALLAEVVVIAPLALTYARQPERLTAHVRDLSILSRPAGEAERAFFANVRDYAALFFVRGDVHRPARRPGPSRRPGGRGGPPRGRSGGRRRARRRRTPLPPPHRGLPGGRTPRARYGEREREPGLPRGPLRPHARGARGRRSRGVASRARSARRRCGPSRPRPRDGRSRRLGLRPVGHGAARREQLRRRGAAPRRGDRDGAPPRTVRDPRAPGSCRPERVLRRRSARPPERRRAACGEDRDGGRRNGLDARPGSRRALRGGRISGGPKDDGGPWRPARRARGSGGRRAAVGALPDPA